MKHIVVVGVLPRSLINFRGDLIKAMINAGHKVTAMSSKAEPEVIEALKKLGVSFKSYPVNRRGLNPLKDIQTMFALHKAFVELKPDIVLAYTIKPVIWGGLAAYYIKLIRFFAMIEGLGYAFHASNWKRKILTKIVSFLYRISLRKASKVIFLNSDNQNEFVARHIIPESKSFMINGIGVNLKEYNYTPLPSSGIIFLSIGRLIGEKGFREFYQAANLVKSKYPSARFQILGPEDSSLDGIPLHEVKAWETQGVIEYLGVTDDVRPYLAACHVFVLASYYEGMPRTSLEAMAIGRPVLTTDTSGCRDTVEEGINGFLVPVKDPMAIAERIVWFIQHTKDKEIEKMGYESRRMAERRFDVHIINKEIFSAMELND